MEPRLPRKLKKNLKAQARKTVEKQDEDDDDGEYMPTDSESDDEEEEVDEERTGGAAHGEVEETFLALFLAREKLRGKHSDWAPWVNVLPSSYPTVLVCWSQEQIDSLCDPVLAQETMESKARIEQTYHVLRRLIDGICAAGRPDQFLFAEKTAFSLDLWYWAWLSVQVGCVRV